ncbi:MAG: hypothetical protein WAO07_18560, partial [Desulfobacterales bacterium]
ANTAPFDPAGPFQVRITLRDGKPAAKKLAARWGFERQGADILFENSRFEDLYLNLLRVCYLTPAIERVLPLALAAANLRGRAGLTWLRRQVKKRGI